MILFAIAAYFSGEPAAQDSQGKMAIGIVILLGLGMIYGGVSAREKEASKAKQAAQPVQTFQTTTVVQTTEPLPPPPPDMVATAFCPYCGKQIQTDFVACPFCGKSVKKTCTKCGKQVENDFVACPYCGTGLKSP